MDAATGANDAMDAATVCILRLVLLGFVRGVGVRIARHVTFLCTARHFFPAGLGTKLFVTRGAARPSARRARPATRARWATTWLRPEPRGSGRRGPRRALQEGNRASAPSQPSAGAAPRISASAPTWRARRTRPPAVRPRWTRRGPRGAGVASASVQPAAAGAAPAHGLAPADASAPGSAARRRRRRGRTRGARAAGATGAVAEFRAPHAAGGMVEGPRAGSDRRRPRGGRQRRRRRRRRRRVQPERSGVAQVQPRAPTSTAAAAARPRRSRTRGSAMPRTRGCSA